MIPATSAPTRIELIQSVGPIPTSCGAPNAGPCGQVNPLPYVQRCHHAASLVCELDPFCCEVTWDAEVRGTEATSQCSSRVRELPEGDLNGDGRIDAPMDLSPTLSSFWGLQDECADIDNDGDGHRGRRRPLDTCFLKNGEPPASDRQRTQGTRVASDGGRHRSARVEIDCS